MAWRAATRTIAALLALAGASAPSRARAQTTAAVTVNVSVDATAAGTPLERVWPFHGYDEINYTTLPEGDGAARDAGRRAQRARARPQSLPAQHRRRHAGDEVGLDQRLHRGRRREPGLQLDADRRDHGHHHRRRRVSVRRDRLHARGALDAPDPLPELQHHDARRRLLLSRRPTTRSGRTSSPPGRCTRTGATRTSPRAGCGSCGTSPTSATGTARSPTTPSSTTTRSRRCTRCSRAPRSAARRWRARAAPS